MDNKEENGIAAPPEVVVNGGSLFLLLSPDLLLLIFGWIGLDDMKAYIRLAISCDRELAHFIYTECTFLWREIDLSKFPGITDVQLESLLERINAQSVTRSILLDKETSSPLCGAGLKPLRHSRVLERIDLRQSTSLELGPTELDDELVAGILRSMLPHKLEMVKVRKQFESNGSPFDEHCFSWSFFLTNMRLFKVQKCTLESCSHCGGSLLSDERFKPQQVLQEKSVQCTVCKLYSCRAWNPQSQCPTTEQCRRCLEWCCPCRQVVTCDYCMENSCSECEQAQLTCEGCGFSSCSECKQVRQCKTCHDTTCVDCYGDIYDCDRCHDSFCEDCKFILFCNQCEEYLCEDCGSFEMCAMCYVDVCKDCQKDERGEPIFAKCTACDFGFCADCYGVVKKLGYMLLLWVNGVYRPSR